MSGTSPPPLIRAEVSAFLAAELERQRGHAQLAADPAWLEELLLAFVGCEAWLWAAPDHGAAQAALTRLRFALPASTRATHQPQVALLARTLREQAGRLVRLERALTIQQEELILLSEQLQRAREPRG